MGLCTKLFKALPGFVVINYLDNKSATLFSTPRI